MAAEIALRGCGTSGKAARSWAPYFLTALLIWLGWQMVVALIAARSPVDFAVRLAPSSGQALSRAAESELAAGRPNSARDIAELALRAAPFDVRALRVLGLTIAASDRDRADELLTLAANRNLRDDPSHAWLVQRRLEQGDYAGAFGHADALARRRDDLWPAIFKMFTVASVEDPRAVPFLIARLAPRPNWRSAYLASLQEVERGFEVQAMAALGLERTSGPLADEELELIYVQWLGQGRLPGLSELRRRLRRPPPMPLQNGEFDGLGGTLPFNWRIEAGPGVQAEISTAPDMRGNALFVETDGFSTRTVIRQLLLLDQGLHHFAGRYRYEAGGQDPGLAWTIRCFETNAIIATWTPRSLEEQSAWTSQNLSFVVPSACSAQWLELNTRRGPRRTSIVAWFDSISITPDRPSPQK